MAHITGTANNDTLTGTTDADLIEGLAGNDTLTGGAGNDTLIGGIGSDKAVYAGARADYVIATGVPAGGGFSVTDINTANGNDGRDIVAGVEQLQFADTTVDVSWTGKHEFRVNTTTANNQWGPSVAALPDGGFIIAWGSDLQDGSLHGVYGQRYDASGAAVGSEFRVNTTTAGEQAPYPYPPWVTTLAGGGFVVTWTGSGPTDASGIYGQRYGASGAATGGEFRINTTTVGDQLDPAVAAFADGGFVVTWSGNGATDDSGVYGQRYNASGAAVGSEFRANTYTELRQYLPQVVAVVADGGFVVTWDGVGTPDDAGIYAQRYNASGATIGNEFLVNTTMPGAQFDPAIAALGGSGFVVTWYTNDVSGYGIYGQRYSASGAAAGSEFRINTTTAGDQMHQSVAALADGGFVVDWRSATPDGSIVGIYGQRYSATGAAVGSEFQINTAPAWSYTNPTIAALADGGFMVTWHNLRQNGDSSGESVAGQRFDASGKAAGDLNLIITGTPGTITGTSGNDVLNGSAGNDVINALAGNDTLNGLGGNDTLNGGDGNDILDGGIGADSMTGGVGDDLFYVDELGDTVIEGPYGGTDSVRSTIDYTMAGYLQNLTLLGTAELNGTGNELDNVLTGNSANNALTGGAGNDTLNGVGGDDTLNGGDGNDTLDGGTGNDTLDGGVGADSMRGGTGNDLYYVADSGDSITEVSGEGTDEVRSSITHTLGSNVENLTLTGTSGINGTGNTLANVLTGNAANNILNGLGGDDSLSGGSGDDTLIGGPGVDNLSGANGADVFVAAPGMNVDIVRNLAGSGGNDLDFDVNLDRVDVSAFSGLTWSTLAPTIAYRDWDTDGDTDAVISLSASDVLVLKDIGGGLTSTSFIFGTSPPPGTLTGTSGNDVLNGSAGNDVINALAGNDTLNGLGGDDTLNGGDGNDTLDGGTGNDTLDGGTGADAMSGRTGNDIYYVDNWSDTVIEVSGEGTDEVRSSITHTLETAESNVENLTLTGSAVITGNGNALNNVLTGNSAANSLWGRDGNDTLIGGGGADPMTGGTGNDIYYVDNMGDTVTEWSNQGTDEVRSSVIHTLGSNVENLTLTGSAVTGNGNALNNVLTGNSAANSLSGLDGNDILYGLGGNDTLSGGNGNDRLIGGDGADRLTGGAGDDRFEFGAASTSPYGAGDTIVDFNTGNDTIVIDLVSGTGAFIGTTAFTSGGSIEVRYDSVADQVQVDLNNNGSFGSGDLQILGLTVAPTASDFLFV